MIEFDDIIIPIQVFFNFLVLLTYPLHVIFVTILIRKRKTPEFGSPFHHLLISIGISDLINATGYLLFQEPAWFGLSAEFFLRNSWWVAKVVMICSIAISNVPLVIHFIVALNRLTAVRMPIRHQNIWREPRVKQLSLIIWGVAITLALPMVYPIEFVGYKMNSGGVAFRFAENFYSQIYTMYVLSLTLFILPTFFIYIYLILCIFFMQFIMKSKTKVQDVVIKSTIAVFITSLGDLILVSVIGSQQLYWMICGSDLMSMPVYWLLFKVGHDLHNIATPWVMLIFFAGIRRDIKVVMSSNRNSSRSYGSIV